MTCSIIEIEAGFFISFFDAEKLYPGLNRIV